jgi:hypothetical protein
MVALIFVNDQLTSVGSDVDPLDLQCRTLVRSRQHHIDHAIALANRVYPHYPLGGRSFATQRARTRLNVVRGRQLAHLVAYVHDAIRDIRFFEIQLERRNGLAPLCIQVSLRHCLSLVYGSAALAALEHLAQMLDRQSRTCQHGYG